MSQTSKENPTSWWRRTSCGSAVGSSQLYKFVGGLLRSKTMPIKLQNSLVSLPGVYQGCCTPKNNEKSTCPPNVPECHEPLLTITI